MEPFINLFFSEIIKLIKSVKSSPFPILSTEIYFFENSLTKSGFWTEALNQLLFFAAIILVFKQLIKILNFPKILALFIK